MSSSSIPSAASFSSPSSSTTTSSLGWLLVLPSLTNGDSDRVVPRDEADLKNAGDLKKPGDIKKPGLRLRVEVVAAPARAPAVVGIICSNVKNLLQKSEFFRTNEPTTANGNY